MTMKKQIQLKHLKTEYVLKLYLERRRNVMEVATRPFIDMLLVDEGWPPRLVTRKLNLLADKKLIDYGVSIGSGWITEKGKKFLQENAEKLQENFNETTS